MNLSYAHLLPENFPVSSKVWIFQGSRQFTLSEVLQVEERLNAFSAQWHSHGSAVKNFATVFFGQFIVVLADETETHVGGCSTDSLNRAVKDMEAEFNISLLNRQTLAFVVKDKIELLPLGQVSYALGNNFITPDTLYFNNTVQTKEGLENEWIIPIKNSWLAKRFTLPSEISQ